MCFFFMLFTVKREYLVAIIFGGFSNMAIWRRINLLIPNTRISKDWDLFILWLILANFLNLPIAPNKLLLIVLQYFVIIISLKGFMILMLGCTWLKLSLSSLDETKWKNKGKNRTLRPRFPKYTVPFVIFFWYFYLPPRQRPGREILQHRPSCLVFAQ